MLFFLIVGLYVLYAEADTLNLTEGSECVRHGLKGKCVGAKSCESFNLVDLRKRSLQLADICTHNNIEVVICCVDCEPFTRDYRDSAITGDKYIWKNGNKSWDKCVEFLNLKEYGCKSYRQKDLKKLYDPKKKCIRTEGWNTGASLAYARNHYRNSVDHIAVLEYGEEEIKKETESQSKESKDTETTKSQRDESSTTQTTEMPSEETSTLKQWLCAGSLISNRFVLTVAQCGTINNRGAVTHVLLGIGSGPDASLEDLARYTVKRFIPHPEYKPPSLYNDIALIETVTQMVFSVSILPICLVYDSSPNENVGKALSWGSDDYRAEGNTGALVITLEKFNPGRCSFHYANDLSKGVNATSQACYKDPGRERSCQSVPGIPFEVENGIFCTRFLAALTSYNRTCGVNDGIGLYTRVLPFIPWIENIVWPEV